MDAQAQEWSLNSFGGNAVLWQEAMACVKFVRSLAFPAIDCFNRVPLLFTRLREPGIKAICDEQFRSVASGLHDRTTLKLMDPDGELFEDYQALQPDGTNMSPELSDQVGWNTPKRSFFPNGMCLPPWLL